MMWDLGWLAFSLKGRESELSQLMVLCCLALFDASLIRNHVIAVPIILFMSQNSTTVIHNILTLDIKIIYYSGI